VHSIGLIFIVVDVKDGEIIFLKEKFLDLTVDKAIFLCYTDNCSKRRMVLRGNGFGVRRRCCISFSARCF